LNCPALFLFLVLVRLGLLLGILLGGLSGGLPGQFFVVLAFVVAR